MRKLRVGVVLVVQNDEETVERSVKAYYDHVEKIVVSTDPRRGWSGKPITPDRSIEIIRSLDTENKIDIIQGDFCIFDDPLKNDTNQRQVTADWLASRTEGLDWVCQIDADEEFLDFTQVVDFLGKAPKRSRGVMWKWLQVFNLLDDGRILVVTDHDGQIKLIPFHLAHRPKATLISVRNPSMVPFRLNQQSLRINEVMHRTNKLTNFMPVFDGIANPSGVCLHYTFAKSESRIQEKLQTWGHAHDFETEPFFDLWKRTKHSWEDVTNFHPLDGPVWPALRAMTIEELRTAVNAKLVANTGQDDGEDSGKKNNVS